MIKKNFPVLYKKNLAIVIGIENDKISIKYQVQAATPTGKKAQYGEQKVREKDIILLIDKEITDLETSLKYNDETIRSMIKETYELLTSDNDTQNSSISFLELVEIIDNNAKPDSIWFIYSSLLESQEFQQDETALKSGIISFHPRTPEEIETINKKAFEKEHQEELYNAFIERLKEKKLLPEDSKYMQEVENLALCKSEKSKVMQDARISQTPEKAHALLIETGIWDITKNIYPTRFGLSMNSATEGLGLPPDEDRVEVPGYAYAIDNAYSNDPDDAVQYDGKHLWIHIADPASSVLPDSSIDKVARNKGTTLYLPEGAFRMLSETCFEEYALGIKEKSRALSFRILLSEENTVEECEVFKTFVNVKRMTYTQATEQKDSPELAPLFSIAEKNIQRRKKAGATNIDLPEVHISVEPETKKVTITPQTRCAAENMICEMMLLAGEGAALFAMNKRIPFPYVSQDAPEIPKEIPEGLAGQFKLLRCMHKRSVGVTPAMHHGLGLPLYSQVTSPLRRYSDLIAHEQLRAYLDGRKLLNKDDMLERISQGDAASVASRKASRLSETHWKLIYLIQNPEWQGNAVCIDHKDGNTLLMIPDLAMQTTIKGHDELKLNEEIKVKASNIDIPTQNCDFIIVQ